MNKLSGNDFVCKWFSKQPNCIFSIPRQSLLRNRVMTRSTFFDIIFCTFWGWSWWFSGTRWVQAHLCHQTSVLCFQKFSRLVQLCHFSFLDLRSIWAAMSLSVPCNENIYEINHGFRFGFNQCQTDATWLLVIHSRTVYHAVTSSSNFFPACTCNLISDINGFWSEHMWLCIVLHPLRSVHYVKRSMYTSQH